MGRLLKLKEFGVLMECKENIHNAKIILVIRYQITIIIRDIL